MLNDIRALTPRIRELAPGIAATGTIPAALHSRLARTGVFRLAAPRWAGGVEADPLVTAGVLEELGWADGSVGWSVMVGAVAGLALGFLPQGVTAELLDDPGLAMAVVPEPAGRAIAVPGGFLVSGHWAVSGGAEHATWLSAGCLIGGVAVRQMLLPVTAVTFTTASRPRGCAGPGPGSSTWRGSSCRTRTRTP